MGISIFNKIWGLLKRKNIAGRYGLFIALILLLIVCSLTSNVFLSFNNIMNVLRQVSVIGIIACGMTFVMTTGGFDLSVGSTLSFSGLLAIDLQDKIGVVPAVIVALIIGIVIGVINGTIIAGIKGKAGEAFIITLGMQMLIQAIALLYTGGLSLRGSDSAAYNYIGKGIIGFIPVPVIIFLVFVTVSQFVLVKTKFGRRVSYLGGNYEAARLSGVNVKAHTIAVYAMVGFTAAVGAVILSARTMGASSLTGEGYEFSVISGVILGGVLNGEGSVLKTLLGVLIIGIIANVMNLWGVSVYDQKIVNGVIILLVVWLNKKR